MKHQNSIAVMLVALGLLLLALAAFNSLPVQAAQLPPAQVSNPTQTTPQVTTVFIPALFKVTDMDEPQQPADGFVEHAGMLIDYVNASSCQECHSEQVHTFGTSNHYLWHGKFDTINDFCGYPNINFGPSKLQTVFGTLVDGGCGTCHAGMGERPTESNPLNADCLICHSNEYRRTLVQVGDAWRFVPDRANMPETISLQEEPTRFSCLACHAYAGGGCNNKRGDMSDALVDPSESEDVHMGNGMTCVDCHVTEDHRIAGRGVDLRIDEGVPMRECTECHDAWSEHDEVETRHLDAVACQSCHIPEFARAVSTDMLRDFREAEVNPKGLYEPVITRQSNVVPEYAFWNGESGFYYFGDPAVDGQAFAWPLGDINDGKLFPFKLHHAIMPQDPVTGAILPVKSKILFETGDIHQAILVGAAEAGFELPEGYVFVDTTRWMGIFHEMPPADDVLECEECHASSDRIDFSALGYDPKDTRDGKPLCTSCHGQKEPMDFYKLHEKHVDDKNIACSECHFFSR